MADGHLVIDLALLARYTSNMKNELAPQVFSISTSEWIALSTNYAGCGYKAEITAVGVTAADYPDIYFDETSLETATAAEIIAGTDSGKVVLYAKSIPTATVSGSYFIKKGATT